MPRFEKKITATRFSKGRYANTAQSRPLDFQPAILRLTDEPPSPLPMAVLKVTIALLIALVGWSFIGKLDVVAVAQGKLVPTSYLKIIQPAEQGIVKEILVSEGSHVAAGDVLIRMDSSLSTADHDSVQSQVREQSLSLRRIAAELSDSDFAKQSSDPLDVFARVDAQFRADRQSYRSSIGLERSSLDHAKSELSAALETEAKMKGLLASFREEEAAYLRLRDRGVVARLSVSEKSRERIQTEQDLRAQAFTIQAARAAIQSSEQKIAQVTSERNHQLQTERADVSAKLAVLEQDLTKASRRQEFLELRAPQDGVIKDLSTHSIGTVVSPGTILLTLVPIQDQVRAEIWIDNNDIGFVHKGQGVKLKLATFQFQKYGMVDGTVIDVSADAQDSTQDKKPASEKPLAYRALVALNQDHVESRGMRFDLLPGMQVSGEINLGNRTVIEYLLSPVSGAFQEAARER